MHFGASSLLKTSERLLVSGCDEPAKKIKFNKMVEEYFKNISRN